MIGVITVLYNFSITRAQVHVATVFLLLIALVSMLNAVGVCTILYRPCNLIIDVVMIMTITLTMTITSKEKVSRDVANMFSVVEVLCKLNILVLR